VASSLDAKASQSAIGSAKAVGSPGWTDAATTTALLHLRHDLVAADAVAKGTERFCRRLCDLKPQIARSS
jgi:hypothetical protein